MIRLHPHPPVIQPDDSVVSSLDFTAIVAHSILRYGSRMFDDELPVSVTLKTSEHVVISGWEMDGDGEIGPNWLNGLEEWFDAVSLDVRDEAIQHVAFVVPTADLVIIQTICSTGEVAYLTLGPGPIPSLLKVSPVHDHLPPGLPEGEYDAMLDVIHRSGRHLWGRAWAPVDKPC